MFPCIFNVTGWSIVIFAKIEKRIVEMRFTTHQLEKFRCSGFHFFSRNNCYCNVARISGNRIKPIIFKSYFLQIRMKLLKRIVNGIFVGIIFVQLI